MTPDMRAQIERAVVRFPGDRQGLGALVPGELVLTAAHVIGWTATGYMALGEDARFYQRIEAGGQAILVNPLAVEPVADLAIFGAVDGQMGVVEDGADEAFEQFCHRTAPVRLATAEFPFQQPVPAHVFTHLGTWLTGHVKQVAPGAHWLTLVPDVPIHSGTSGGPVVTDEGRLLGLVSWSGNDASTAWGRLGSIPRPPRAAPRWLSDRMLGRRPRGARAYYAEAVAAAHRRAEAHRARPALETPDEA